MALLLYGIFLAHLNAYKNYYMNIGITFAITYTMKRLIKQGSKDYADLVGLGGYILTIGEFVKLLAVIKTSGIQGVNPEEANQIIGGLFGKGINLVKDLFIK